MAALRIHANAAPVTRRLPLEAGGRRSIDQREQPMPQKIDLSRYELSFSDEFTKLSLNDGVNGAGGTWTPDGYWGQRTLGGNGERQLYVDPAYKGLGLNPFSIKDDVLTIRAEPISAGLKPQLENLDYTSGMITSEQSFSQQYGYFEMRAQLPAGQGLWPAFWLLNQDGEWPPELDVMEVLGNDPTKLYTTVHTKQTGAHDKDAAGTTVADMSKGFHTYGVDWQADKITFYFDGEKVFDTPTPADMHQPMYMIANMAVGGHWPGNPNGSTPFPADMKIDYIRAYQEKADEAAVGVPSSWAPVDMAKFSTMKGEGAAKVWDFRSTMAPGQTAIELQGDWARYVTGNDGDNFIRGSDAPYNQIEGGKGRDVMEGRGGVNVFTIRKGDGYDTILDLQNQTGEMDKIKLDGFHFDHFDDVKPWLRQEGDDVVLRLGQDQALLLKDTKIAELASEQFFFTNVTAAPGGATPVPTTPAPKPEPKPEPAPDPVVVAPKPEPKPTPEPTPDPVVVAPKPEPKPNPEPKPGQPAEPVDLMAFLDELHDKLHDEIHAKIEDLFREVYNEISAPGFRFSTADAAQTLHGEAGSSGAHHAAAGAAASGFVFEAARDADPFLHAMSAENHCSGEPGQIH